MHSFGIKTDTFINGLKDSDINPHNYEHLNFDKEAKIIQWRKKSTFHKWCLHNWMVACRRMQIAPYLSSCIKLKSKWIKDGNINPVTLNLIEKKVVNRLDHIGRPLPKYNTISTVTKIDN